MIKAFNINLAGQIFNINEDAYEQLLAYFNSLENFYANEEGKDEILNDIKSRFAELFLAKGKNYIITNEDATQAINNMGRPEEFESEENKSETTTNSNETSRKTSSTGTSKNKRLYRDPDSSIVAGVCSGVSYYFGISDPVWVRIAFILMVFIGFGSPFIIYLVLWMILPEANTSAQKLEMKGEPINVSNIEKKVKDEFNKVSENFNNNGQGVLGKIVDIIGNIVKIFFKIILGIGAAVLAFVGSITIFGLFIAAIVIGAITFFGIPFLNSFFFNNTSDGWLFGVGGLLVSAIPIIFIIVAIVHILSKKSKPLKKQIVFPLIGLFLFGILLLNISGKHAKTLLKETKKVNQTFPLNYQYKSDTIQLSMNPAIKDEDYNNMNITINGVSDLLDFISDHDDKFFPVEIEVYPSLSDSFTVIKEYSARGKNEKDAIINATSFKHNIAQINNKLIIDPYIEFNDVKTKFRNQKLKIKVFVPEGKVIRWDRRTEEYIDVDKIAINWDNIINGNLPPAPTMPPMPPMPPMPNAPNVNSNKNTNSSINKSNVDEALDKAQDALDAAREKLESMRDSIDNSDDNNDAVNANRLQRQHYIFRMVNGELVAID